jgi:hypothetical protein
MPHFLPDGVHFLYTVLGGDRPGVYLGSLDDKTIQKALVPLHTSAVFAPPGYLLWVEGDALMGRRFDAHRIEMEGQQFLVAERVGHDTAFKSAVSASRSGVIAYSGAISQPGRLTWVNRKGDVIGPAAGAREGVYTDFRLSPDEKNLAVSLADPKTGNVAIWLTDLSSNRAQPFASGGAVTAAAIWSRDGRWLLYRTNRRGNVELFRKSAAGGGSDQPLEALVEALSTGLLPSLNGIPTDWSPDARHILFSTPDTLESGNDLWLLPTAGSEKPSRLIDSPGDQVHGTFSRDGQLVAYSSNESGRYEIYVETVPRSDRKILVSNNGGYEPQWRGDQGELYYLSGDRQLMAVTVGSGQAFGTPRPLFQTRVAAEVSANRMHYVPSADGQRFLLNIPVGDATSNPITIIVNWTATLRQ